MRNKNDEPLLCCDECKRQIVMDYGVKAEPLTMLCGFPVVFTDKVPSLGTAGPIILGSLPDTPPSEFWVIEYAGLVFDRTLLAFVPMGFLRKAVPLDAMKRVMYEDVEEARAQKNELAALGVVAALIISASWACRASSLNSQSAKHACPTR